MKRVRVIPMVTVQDWGVVKSVKFKNHRYIGDPINTVKLFNDKEVDELAVLDIGCSRKNNPIQFDRIKEVVSEAFMPIAYGGGIQNPDQIRKIFDVGVEKVILNTHAASSPSLIQEGAKIFGSQSMVVSIDYKKNWLGKRKVYVQAGTRALALSPIEYAKRMEEAGAGELILTSIEREGTFSGYDVEGVREIAEAVNIPVVINGGAAGTADFLKGILEGKASAVAAGSRFVYSGRTHGILINYPSQEKLKEELFSKLD